MDVSIIIVNFNSVNLVKDCIQSIFEKTTGLSYEIIVIDNNSQDYSVKILENEFADRIKLIKSDKNLGFGKANNLGVKYAVGSYIFLLNPDTVLVNNAIKILIDFLNNTPSAGVAGANLYGPAMEPAPSYSLCFDDLQTEKKKSSWKSIIGEKLRTKMSHASSEYKRPFEHQFNYTGTPQRVGYIFGADMMLKKELFEEMNGFDPDFFMYAEEEELSWRIHASGKEIFSVPDAIIIHLEGMTVKAQNSFSEKQFRMRMNGGMTYYYKRFGLEGVNKFFKYRSRRYERLIKIARLKKKPLENFGPYIMKACLEDEYFDFIRNKKV